MNGPGAVLDWQTNNEYNTSGFYLYRNTQDSHEGAQQVNANLIPGCGACIGGASYVYTDTNAPGGVTLYYWLVDVDNSGGRNWNTTSPGNPRPLVLPADATSTNTPTPETPEPPTATFRMMKNG